MKGAGASERTHSGHSVLEGEVPALGDNVSTHYVCNDEIHLKGKTSQTKMWSNC